MIFSKKEQSIEIKLDLFELSLYRFAIDEIIHWTKSSIQMIIHDIHFLFTFRCSDFSYKEGRARGNYSFEEKLKFKN